MRTLTAATLLLATLPFFVNANSENDPSESFIAKVVIEKSGRRVAEFTLPLLPNQEMDSSTVIAFNRHLQPTHSASAQHKFDGESNSARIWLTADNTLAASIDSAECGAQRLLAAVSKDAESALSMTVGECVVSLSLSKSTDNAH